MEEDDFERILLEEDFSRWAFGIDTDENQFISGENMVKRWNDLHSDLFIASPKGDARKDLDRMQGFWAIEGFPSSTEQDEEI